MLHVCPEYIGSAYAGGATGHGSIFSYLHCLGEKKHIEVIHSFCDADDPSCDNGENPVGNIIRMNDGSLIGVTQNGGPYQSGTIFSLTAPTKSAGAWQLRVIKSFCSGFGCHDGGMPNGNLVSRSVWNFQTVVGTTAMGGMHGKGTLWELVPSPKGTGYYVLESFKK
jgi:uncharacterized repeat protein (TIGR03803 family)